MALDATLATLDGRLEDAVEITDRIETRAEELGLSEYARGMVETRIRPLFHLGKANEDFQRSLELAADDYSKAFCLAHLGRNDEVAAILEQLVVARPGIGSAEDETAAWSDVLLLESAVLVEHRQAADLLLRRFSDSSIPTTGQRYATCVARHLGAAAALLGKLKEARAYYQEALKVANETRFRPEVALTRFQLAELLLEHYPKEKTEALEHLSFAIKEFSDMKMQPSLERALKDMEILGA